MGLKLYEITNQLVAFEEICDLNDIPEDVKRDTLDSLNLEFTAKADNIACLVKNLKAEVAAIRAEAKNLLKRADAKDNNADWLLNGYLLGEMKAADIKRIETSRNIINIRQNPENVEMDDKFIDWAQQNNHDDLLKFTPPVPYKPAIKAALKENKQEILHAKLVRKERLEIR